MKGIGRRKLIRIITAIMLSIVIGVTLFVVPQIAAEVSRSKILVIDDGQNQEKVNGDVSVHQRIISSTDKDMTVKVDFKNYLYKSRWKYNEKIPYWFQDNK